MLRRLSIRDLALIDRLDLEFEEGLTVLTGETGAGKSILLDALGLTLGGRAAVRLVRYGAAQATATAVFEPPPWHPVLAMLEAQSLDTGSSLILRRVVRADGRSRAFVNDQPISVAQLQRFGRLLVEIQGQFDLYDLLDAAGHHRALDAFAGLTADRQACMRANELWRRAVAQREAVETAVAAARREVGWLRHSVAELEAFAPQPDEEARLTAERSLARHATQVNDGARRALSALEDAGGIIARLGETQRLLERSAAVAEGRLDEARAALERVAVEAGEASASLRAALVGLDADGIDADAVEERLFALRDLARKHEVDPATLPETLHRLRTDLMALEDRSSAQAALCAEEQRAAVVFRQQATRLSAARREAAARLAAAVNAELPPLKLERARFVVVVSPLPEDRWTATGADAVTFQASTNPGAPAAPLEKIASGGELSRFLLALKVSLATQTSTPPVLVFDEVDSGVGGATAAAVGERLARLAERGQVLVVTHSPQVAARGRQHWRVVKHDAAAVVVTTAMPLTDAARCEEIARMLSGHDVTDEARAAARRLLESEDAP